MRTCRLGYPRIYVHSKATRYTFYSEHEQQRRRIWTNSKPEWAFSRDRVLQFTILPLRKRNRKHDNIIRLRNPNAIDNVGTKSRMTREQCYTNRKERISSKEKYLWFYSIRIIYVLYDRTLYSNIRRICLRWGVTIYIQIPTTYIKNVIKCTKLFHKRNHNACFTYEGVKPLTHLSVRH